jgi:hypothetical protein
MCAYVGACICTCHHLLFAKNNECAGDMDFTRISDIQMTLRSFIPTRGRCAIRIRMFVHEFISRLSLLRKSILQEIDGDLHVLCGRFVEACDVHMRVIVT